MPSPLARLLPMPVLLHVAAVLLALLAFDAVAAGAAACYACAAAHGYHLAGFALAFACGMASSILPLHRLLL